MHFIIALLIVRDYKGYIASKGGRNMATDKEMKQSLIAAVRKHGQSALADKLEKLTPKQVKAYLADFAQRHNVKEK